MVQCAETSPRPIPPMRNSNGVKLQAAGMACVELLLSIRDHKHTTVNDKAQCGGFSRRSPSTNLGIAWLTPASPNTRQEGSLYFRQSILHRFSPFPFSRSE